MTTAKIERGTRVLFVSRLCFVFQASGCSRKQCWAGYDQDEVTFFSAFGAEAERRATDAGADSTSDTAILSRLIRDDEGLSIDAAESLLRLRFEPDDLARLHDLTIRNQGDQLNPEERTELESYRRVSYLLVLLHSKARRALKKHRADR